MTLTTEQLDKLTRGDLLELLKQLLPLVGEFERPRQRVEELETENGWLKNRSTNLRNSSQPLLRDQKVNCPRKEKRKKHGPPFGHPKYSRPLVERIDRVIIAGVRQCQHCQATLKEIKPDGIRRRQITELLRSLSLVIETQQHKPVCPHCQMINYSVLPQGLEAGRYFGLNLEAAVIYYKHPQHLSYEWTVETMRDFHGVNLSEGAVAQILKHAGQKAGPVAQKIKQQVIIGPVIKSDETIARVECRNWRQWVFISEDGIYHTFVLTRSAAEIAAMIGQLCPDAWVSDYFGAQLKAPARVFQLCLAHQLRDLQRMLDADPLEKWARELQKLFRTAVHLHNRFMNEQDEITLRGFQGRLTQIDNRLDSLLGETVRSETARELLNRFTTHRDKLLNFSRYPEIPPTNNKSEQTLHGNVVHRKATNGFRSKWGSQSLRQPSNCHCDYQAQRQNGLPGACRFDGSACSPTP